MTELNDAKTRPPHGGDVYGAEIDYDFSTSVSPFARFKRVRETLLRGLERLDRYPDLEQRAFRRAVARLEGVDDAEILGGNGASELLAGIARAISPKNALVCAPSFSGYEHALRCANVETIERAYLEENKGYAVGEETLERIEQRFDALFLADPNNPTGLNLRDDLLFAVLDRCAERGVAVVVDESFLRLSGKTSGVAPLVYQYSNLYVVSAFTKTFALPGLRIGYCASQARNLAQVRRALPEWNMSTLAQDVGVVCAELSADLTVVSAWKRELRREVEFLSERLRSAGLQVFPTDSNFFLARAELDLYASLLDRRILIRDCSNFDGLGKGFYRIAVKSREANAALADAITAIMGGR